jgi:pyrophosphatase PpaX
MKTVVRGVLLDFDETIVYSNKDHVKSYIIAAKKWGLRNPDGKIEAMIGRSAINILAGLFPDLALEDLIRLRDEKEVAYRNIIAHKRIRMIAGLKNLLDFLRREKIKIGIVSSASMKNINLILRRLGLKKYFKVIVGAETVKEHKPKPEPILVAVRRLGLRPRDCVYVGDSIYDMMAARNAHTIGYGMETGYYNWRQLRRSGARQVFRSHHEFLRFLKRECLLESQIKKKNT